MVNQRERAGSIDPAPVASSRNSGRLLLTQCIDELDQLDRAIPILGGRGMKTLLLAVLEAIEGCLVLGRRVEERLRDRSLGLFRQIGIVGIGAVDDRRRLVDDA